MIHTTEIKCSGGIWDSAYAWCNDCTWRITGVPATHIEEKCREHEWDNAATEKERLEIDLKYAEFNFNRAYEAWQRAEAEKKRTLDAYQAAFSNVTKIRIAIAQSV